MKSIRNIALAFSAAVALSAAFVLVLALLSPAALWNLGLSLGQRDYDYITGLRDQLRKEPTDTVVLAKILARTEDPNGFSRGNAIAVLMQLSYYNSPTGRQIYAKALPVFVRALAEQDQSIKTAALEGLENLGPYALSAIPDVKQKISDPDPIVRQEANEVLATLEKFQTNEPAKSYEPGLQKVIIPTVEQRPPLVPHSQ